MWRQPPRDTSVPEWCKPKLVLHDESDDAELVHSMSTIADFLASTQVRYIIT